jgi:membrane protease YdiL (CAAX protease family)
MQPWWINVWRILNDWLRAALGNAQTVRESPMLPAWLAVGGVAIDFGFMGLWFRYTDHSWDGRSIVSCGLMFLVRLATVNFILVWACRHYQIPTAALGIRPSTLSSDFQWSFRICVLGAFVIVATLAMGFALALALGMRLPAPSELSVQFLGGNWSVGYTIFMLGLGITGTLLVVVTEELIYRSLFLPVLTSQIGLYPAVAVTAIVFGLAHVIPFGHMGIPAPQIIGGLLMAAGFAIRWSVVPAMVIHAMGNLFVGFVVLIYVRLFEASPTLFHGQ